MFCSVYAQSIGKEINLKILASKELSPVFVLGLLFC